MIGEPEIEPAPDPRGVADDILNGAPRGSTSTERTRRFRERQRARESGAAATEPITPPVTFTAQESATLIDATWSMALVPIMGTWKDGTPRIKHLTPAQAQRLGEAYAPLMTKYLPLLAAWQTEIAALVVTLAVVREATNPKPPWREPVFTMEGDDNAGVPVTPQPATVAP